MPRFYMHVHEGDEIVRDLEGQEFPDSETAREDAIVSAREMAAECVLRGRPINAWIIEVADDQGQVVTVVALSDQIWFNRKLPN